MNDIDSLQIAFIQMKLFYVLYFFKNCPLKTALSIRTLFVVDNEEQTSEVPVYVQVLDINDHAPEFPEFYKVYVCENASSGQVRTHNKLLMY